MHTKPTADAVDKILAQWRRERPDLDISAMGTIGRLKRCAALVQGRLDDTFADYSLVNWEFDMLATLRRSGAPYRLTPTTLFSTLMITSGTMTHRLQKLEAKGWIARVAHASDARSTLVQLTNTGLDLINSALEAHVGNEQAMLEPLSPNKLAALEAGLIALLATLETAKD